MYITKLKGVGKKTGHLFLKQGISTVNDLIDLIPTYENYNLTTINESSHQNIITIECVIDGEIKQINTKKAKFVKFDVLYNNNTYLEVYAFNQLFLTKVLRFGQTITIKGKYDHYLKRVTANKILTKSF